jgi:hypothetical protein
VERIRAIYLTFAMLTVWITTRLPQIHPSGLSTSFPPMNRRLESLSIEPARYTTG